MGSIVDKVLYFPKITEALFFYKSQVEANHTNPIIIVPDEFEIYESEMSSIMSCFRQVDCL